MKKVYEHYGCKAFDMDKFMPITNMGSFPKPRGGLWASPVNTEFGWIQWCEKEEFAHYNPDNKFQFRLSDSARVLEIRSVEQIKEILPSDMYKVCYGVYVLDFERLCSYYDAVELFLTDNGSLYHDFYGWDCDSIVILNPDIIETI